MIGRTNTGGGGSIKGTDAILRVIAPAGSTVTISKGGVSKSDLGHENADDNSKYDYYFIIHQSQFDGVNPWTVTATLGSDTATDTIIIDSSNEYNVIISYHVPEGYQEVEYLKATGTQYLKLPITSDSIKGGRVRYLVNTYVDWSALFGSSTGTGTHISGSFGLIISTGTPGAGFEYNGTRTALSCYSANVDYTLDFSVTSGSQTYTLNNTTVTASASGTISSRQTYLFAWNYNNSIKSAELAKTQIYEFSCVDGDGNKIIDLYPCYRISDSVAGMWDRVSETFLTNEGSGSFVVGGNV